MSKKGKELCAKEFAENVKNNFCLDVSDEEFQRILESNNQENLLPIIAKKLQYKQELMLCQKGNKQVLYLYISVFKLNLEGQLALIDRDYQDILKLHFLAHGINREAIAYYHDLKVFKEYLGIK
ncbi:MAG: hypothetical protein IKW58_01350 [Alphaproteobacteria bacterium]|nr:hypothetical protein [Alphaproteobacteria bacterium]